MNKKPDLGSHSTHCPPRLPHPQLSLINPTASVDIMHHCIVGHRLFAGLAYCVSLTRAGKRRHTPNIAFRHFLSNSVRTGYSTEGAGNFFAQLSTDAVSAHRRVLVLITPRASLSGTFLQTLPDLVTALKGHSLFPRSCPATRSAPSERLGHTPNTAFRHLPPEGVCRKPLFGV